MSTVLHLHSWLLHRPSENRNGWVAEYICLLFFWFFKGILGLCRRSKAAIKRASFSYVLEEEKKLYCPLAKNEMQLERSPGSFEELQCTKCFGPNSSLAEGFPNSPCHTWLWPLPPRQPLLPPPPTPDEAPSQALSPCSVLHFGTQGTRDSNAAICLPSTK